MGAYLQRVRSSRSAAILGRLSDMCTEEKQMTLSEWDKTLAPHLRNIEVWNA